LAGAVCNGLILLGVINVTVAAWWRYVADDCQGGCKGSNIVLLLLLQVVVQWWLLLVVLGTSHGWWVAV